MRHDATRGRMNNILPINKVICGDAIEQLKIFPDNYFDSIVTDPPAGISFMGKAWDDNKGGRDQWINWLSDVMKEGLRVLKPGSHALVWALPRTSHWTAMSLEDAGFEIRDCIYHIFGSGFPKSLDISKQIDKQAGVEREVIGNRTQVYGYEKDYDNSFKNAMFDVGNNNKITFPKLPEAKQWSGWGTALKPAVECWWLVRKPIREKTVAENVLKWGAGGINIDGCRIEANDQDVLDAAVKRMTGNPKNNGIFQQSKLIIPKSAQGRFPANLIHDGSDEVLAEFPITKRVGHFNSKVKMVGHTLYEGGFKDFEQMDRTLNDSGSAARFFYCAKPSRSERDKGLEGMIKKKIDISRKEGNPGGDNPRNRGVHERTNHHPTVKAQALMEYLIKLITPPNSIGLDMFAGSGSTLIAYKKLGHRYIGIEIDPDYCKIAEQRLIADLTGNRSLDAYNEYEPKSINPAFRRRAKVQSEEESMFDF